MLALVLTMLTPQTVLGDAVCFDLEVGVGDLDINDDEINEETKDKICVWRQGEHNQKKCSNGMERMDHAVSLDPDYGCIQFDHGTFNKGDTYFISTDGSDALWVDKISVHRMNEWGEEWEETWGKDNHDGYCLSNDRNDHLDWNHDDRDQYVPDEQCFYQLRLNPGGSVSGWVTNEKQICRERKKMDCKQGCPSGWSHVDTTDEGCCASFGSCFGDKKICQKDEYCRRRSEVDENTTYEVLEPTFEEGTGYWVELSSPSSDRGDAPSSALADRLSQAESSEAESSEVQLSATESTEESEPEQMTHVEVSEGL